jgi:hypothetical protein
MPAPNEEASVSLSLFSFVGDPDGVGALILFSTISKVV